MNPYYTGLFDGRIGQDFSRPLPIRMPQGGPKRMRVAPPTTNTPMGGPDYFGAAAGALDIVNDTIAMSREGLNLDTTIAPQSDMYGRPVYTAGNVQNQASSAKPQGATFGEVSSLTMKGAQAGSSFGPVGTGIGAAIGFGAGLFGGRRRKRRQQREKERALQSVQKAQTEYNEADVSFRDQVNQLEDYRQRSNPYRRLRNIYG